MNLEKAEERREEILATIYSIGDMRRGTLTERYLSCGRAGCHCNKPGSPGHGPKFSLTTKVDGKTKTDYIQAHHVKQVREQIETGKQFTALSKELFEISVVICNLHLEQDIEEDSKKNSARRSKRNSAMKSSGC